MGTYYTFKEHLLSGIRKIVNPEIVVIFLKIYSVFCVAMLSMASLCISFYLGLYTDLNF